MPHLLLHRPELRLLSSTGASIPLRRMLMLRLTHFFSPLKKLVIDKIIEHYLHMARIYCRVALCFITSRGLFFAFLPILLSRFARMQTDPEDHYSSGAMPYRRALSIKPPMHLKIHYCH